MDLSNFLLLVVIFAPIAWVYECAKDVASCKSTPTKKCIAGIGFVITLPLAFIAGGFLLTLLGNSLSGIADTNNIIPFLEEGGLLLIVLIVIAIISSLKKQNNCNNSYEENKGNVSEVSGNNKFIIMLVAVLAVLALIGYGIISSMTK